MFEDPGLRAARSTRATSCLRVARLQPGIAAAPAFSVTVTTVAWVNAEASSIPDSALLHPGYDYVVPPCSPGATRDRVVTRVPHHRDLGAAGQRRGIVNPGFRAASSGLRLRRASL